jgi:hypothetical protein
LTAGVETRNVTNSLPQSVAGHRHHNVKLPVDIRVPPVCRTRKWWRNYSSLVNHHLKMAGSLVTTDDEGDRNPNPTLTLRITDSTQEANAEKVPAQSIAVASARARGPSPLHRKQVCSNLTRKQVCSNLTRKQVCSNLTRKLVCSNLTRKLVCSNLTRKQVCSNLTRKLVCSNLTGVCLVVVARTILPRVELATEIVP